MYLPCINNRNNMAPHQTQVHVLLDLQKSAINKYCVIKSMTYEGIHHIAWHHITGQF